MSLAITDHDPGIRVLHLDRPPVNALSPALVEALRDALDVVMADPAVHAVVLSGGPKVFSAGLDVPTLVTLDPAAMAVFWRDFLGVAARLARADKPVAAAIDGHSPAGGAGLALFCDVRIMAEGPFQIGLNEVQVGLAVPGSIIAALRRQVGPRQAEHLLQGEPPALILVNRKLDIDGGDGMEIIGRLLKDDKSREIPVMLVSNYPQYQAEAGALGARPGFGKSELGTPASLDKLRPYLA